MLAVSLFADIAGYTALMQRDESAAVVFLNRFKSALDECVPAHGGFIVQFYGDGVLALFDSAAGAMDCALSLQNEFGRKPAIPVRIGLNDGEVVMRSDNAFGDSINIASRIESIAVPGSILFSGSVNDQIHNKSRFVTERLGKFHFKNVDKEIEVFALTNGGLPIPKRGEIKGKLKVSTIKWWRVVVALLAVIALLSILAIRFANPAEKRITTENKWLGSWKQEVESSNGTYLPGTVHFLDSVGMMSGQSIHEYTEVDMELSNTLYNIVHSENLESISGSWRSDALEQHGHFKLSMDPSGSGFEGYYTALPDTVRYRWTGTRQ